MKELSSEQIEELRSLLIELRDAIEQQLQHNASSSAPVELDQTLVGRVSRVDAMQQQSIALGSRQNLIQRQRKIAAALQAMEKDDYGYCRHCDEPIAYPRLKVQPEASLCLRCQEKLDQSP